MLYRREKTKNSLSTLKQLIDYKTLDYYKNEERKEKYESYIEFN